MAAPAARPVAGQEGRVDLVLGRCGEVCRWSTAPRSSMPAAFFLGGWVRVVRGGGPCLVAILGAGPSPVGVVWVFVLSTGVGPPGTKVRTSLPGLFGLAGRSVFAGRPGGPYVQKTQGSRGKVRCLWSRVLGPVRPGRYFGGNVLGFALRWGSTVVGNGFQRRMFRVGRWVPSGGRSQASALGCSLGERPNNAHIILSVTPNLFWGKWWSGVIDGGGQAMGRTVWKVEGFPENCGFVHHEANTIQDFSCSLVARGDVGPLMAPRTHQPLGFLGTTRTRWCCFRTKVLVFPDTPPLLPSGCPPTGSTPWKRPTEAPPSRFGPAKNKAAGQPLIAFCSACHPSPLQTN